MSNWHRIAFAAIALLAWVGAASGAQSVLVNGSMELGDGPFAVDPMIPASWTLLGNVVERSGEANLVPASPPDGGHALKAFQSNPTEQAYQEIPVAPGNSVNITAQLYTRASDKLGGDALAGIALGFFDNLNNEKGTTVIDFKLNQASPADTWIPASVTRVAPAGTTKARLTCVWLSNSGSGSAYWDDVQLKVNGGPNLVVNGDFETAGVGAQSPVGIDNWVGFNDQQQSTEQALHGTKSVRVGMGEAYNGLVQELPDMFEGDRLILRTQVLQTSTNGLTANARAGLKLEWLPVGGGGALPGPTENLAFSASSPVDEWVFVDIGTVGVEIPDGASIARVTMIFAPDTSTVGFAYFDQAFAATSRAPAANLLLNASFESGLGGANGLDNWTEFGPQGQQSFLEVPALADDLVNEDFFGATMKAGGNDYAGVYQQITLPDPLLPNEKLYVRAYLRQRADNKLLGTARAGVKIEWIAGNIPGWVDITEGPSNNTIDATSPKDTWIPLEIDYTMQPGFAAKPKFVLLTAAGAGSGYAYYDNCEAVYMSRFDGSDSDGDDDQDLFDFAGLQRCFNGDGAGELGFNCTVFDVDEDLDVDLIDFAAFEPQLTGP